MEGNDGVLNWDRFWKDDKQNEYYHEFLINPKETFKIINERFNEIEDENNRLKIEIETQDTRHEDEVANIETELTQALANIKQLTIENDTKALRIDSLLLSHKTELDTTQRLCEEQVRIAREEYENKKSSLIEEYKQLEINLETKLKNWYESSLEKEKAKLETQYHHEMHEFLEEQRDKEREMVGEVVRNAIIGFENERANSAAAS